MFTDEDCDLIWTDRIPPPAPGQKRISIKKYIELYKSYLEVLDKLAKAKNPSGSVDLPNM